MDIKYLLWAEGQAWLWSSNAVESWALPHLQPGWLEHCRARLWNSARSKLKCFSKMKQLSSWLVPWRHNPWQFLHAKTGKQRFEWLSLLPDPPHCCWQGCPGTWQHFFTLDGSASKTSWPAVAQAGPWSLSKTFSSVRKGCQDPPQKQWRE